jgi:hypothetical protein
VYLRLEQREDPASAEYEARLSAALDGEYKIIVGATIAYENTVFRVPGIIRADGEINRKSLYVWSTAQAPVLPRQVNEAVDVLRMARVGAVAR